MKQKNVVLTGFMGSGKTSVGLRLSYRLRRPVEDTDKLIERREGRTINEIFAREGRNISGSRRRSCSGSWRKGRTRPYFPWEAARRFALRTGSF